MKTSHKSDELKKKKKQGEGVYKSCTYDCNSYRIIYICLSV